MHFFLGGGGGVNTYLSSLLPAIFQFPQKNLTPKLSLVLERKYTQTLMIVTLFAFFRGQTRLFLPCALPCVSCVVGFLTAVSVISPSARHPLVTCPVQIHSAAWPTTGGRLAPTVKPISLYQQLGQLQLYSLLHGVFLVAVVVLN